eukprot:959506-Alexandrium_andersonii.AAC.1
MCIRDSGTGAPRGLDGPGGHDLDAAGRLGGNVLERRVGALHGELQEVDREIADGPVVVLIGRDRQDDVSDP